MEKVNKVNKINVRITLEGHGLVNYNGNRVPERFIKEMIADGKVTKNGNFGKENLYSTTIINDEGKEETIITPKKIISGNLMRKKICGGENTPNADVLCSVPESRASFLSQDNVIVRGFATMEKDGVNLHRKSAITVTDAEQISDIKTNIDTRSAEGKRDDTSLFFVEKCGHIEYESNASFDIKQLQFISTDDDYDRMTLKETDVDLFIEHIDERYGKGNAKYGNWGTSHRNIMGEQGIILSNKVAAGLVRSTIEKMLMINIKHATSYAKTKSIEISLGYENDEFDLITNPVYHNINNMKEYDTLMKGKVIGENFIKIQAPVIEKKEKKVKAKK